MLSREQREENNILIKSKVENNTFVFSKDLNSYLSIEIDDFIFYLINTVQIENYMIMRIYSAHNISTEIAANFYVYPSNSELGCWRYCSTDPRSEGSTRMYKGNNHLQYPDINDYIQATFIHIKLQKFINDNLIYTYKKTDTTNLFTYGENKFTCNPPDIRIQNIINNQDRIIKEAPFIGTAKFTKCGKNHVVYTDPLLPSLTVNDVILGFSMAFKNAYNILYDSIKPEYKLKYTFKNIIRTEGIVYSVELERKILIEGSQSNNIILYYLETNILPILKNATEQYHTAIVNVCSKDFHIIPIFLTSTTNTINEIGLNNKYISCGAYICKMFDYSTVESMQCTLEEVRVGRCTPHYSFIGARYENIFPLKEIIENKHVTCPIAATTTLLEETPPKVKLSRRLLNFFKFGGGTRKIKKSKKSRKIKKIKNKISSFFKVFSKRK